MRLLISLFLIPFSAICQKAPDIQTGKIERFFKKVDRIEIIEIKQSCDSFKTEEFRSLLRYDSIDFSRIQKRVNLTGSEIDSLKSIFLIRNDSVFGGRSMCYSPRNGIFFYNKKGELLGYYELCFECNNYKLLKISWEDHLSLGQKIRIIKFFEDRGIRTFYNDC